MQRSSAEKKPRDYAISTSVVVLVAVVAWAIGAFVLWGRVLPGLSARDWEATQCEVINADVRVDKASDESGYSRGCDSDSVSISIEYRFRAAGREYKGDRYGFASNHFAGTVPTRGASLPCYYDPDDPTESVIDRTNPTGAFDIGVLAFCLLLAALLAIRAVNAFRYPPVHREVAPTEPPPQ